MSRKRRRTAISRPLHLEVLEPRAMMAGQTALDLHVDPFELTTESQQVSTMTLPNAYTGLAGVRTDYGFDGRGQTVAVIDTGIAYDHYALGGGYGANYRVVGGWDFADNDANPWDDGPYGSHGTHVAGIVGSTDSGGGVAPGVDLVALRVFDDSGAGSFTWIDQALQWVHQHRNDFAHPITAVNMSIGTAYNGNTPPAWAMLETDLAQLEADGIFVAVAAGNSFGSYNVPGVSYPAASSHVVPVASVDGNGNLSSFSQRNDRSILAPGQSIRSTVPDYVGNLNGITDDFAYYSGTSMASPYVAGSSVLLRQAMQFAGQTGITETKIYDVMRNTSDIVFDSATNANYHRLNLQRAIDSVMGPDDYGSTADAAFNLGTLMTGVNRAGVIGKLNDQDYFKFTAGQSGTITFTVAAQDQLAPQWDLSALQATTSSDGLSFSVQVAAGQTYTFGMRTTSGLGHYTLTADLQASSQNLGIVDFMELKDQHITGGESWLAMTAKRSGRMSVEAIFANANGNVDLEIYDSNGNLLASSATANDGERLDLNVTAGAVYNIRVIGNNADVDFRIANLLSQSGNVLTVFGTAGNDTFVMTAGATHQITINGVNYQVDGGSVQNVVFSGGAGTDTAQFNLTSGNETVTLRPGTADITGSGYEAHANGVESFTVYGGGGSDVVSMYGSSGSDTLVARPTQTTFTGVGYADEVNDFATVNAYAGTGGTDTAYFYDSAGNDTFTARTTYSVMQGAGFYNYGQGFSKTVAYSSGGADVASMYDSKGNDTFTSGPTQATLAGKGFQYQANNFSQVYAYSSGGRDTANMYGSAGDDTFTLRTTYASMSGPGYYDEVRGFKYVYAYASGGYDTALLYDSAGDDRLTARKGYVGLSNSKVAAGMWGFDRAKAYGTAGGRNTRQLAALDYILERYGKW